MFSATQVSKYEDCPRRWGWEYLDKLKPPKPKSMQFGLDGHAWLEDFVASPEMPPDGEFFNVTAPGRRLWPEMTNPQIEAMFKMDLNGVPFMGYMDLTWVDTSVHVMDHKFTSSIKKYSKSAEDLLDDVQATLYVPAAHYLHGTDPDTIPVDLHWVYYSSKQPYDGKHVHLRVMEEDVAPRIDKTLMTAAEMQAVKAAGLRARDMEPNWDACFHYGPCPFRSNCEMEEKMGTGNSILSKLRNKAPSASVEKPAEDPGLNSGAPAAEKAVADIAGQVVEVVKAVQPKVDAKEKKPAARKKVTLYIDCMPTKGLGKMADASELIDRAQATLTSPHYKCEDFGKGAGFFAAALKQIVEKDGLPEHLFLSLGTCEGRDACQVLVSFADTVVRGMPK